ncbi:MAG: hypothetical protein MK108_02045 [Mariniblastus sp.]|nr:hypothetical protein [Mariniblastus sp.]
MPRIEFILVACLLLGGCAPWDSAGIWKSDAWLDQRPEGEEAERIQLPANRMAKDSVTLEIAVGQLDLEQQEDLDQLWQEVDQQALPIDVRQRLDQNGFMVGLIASQPPAILDRLLQEKAVDTSGMEPWQIEFIERGNQTTVPRLILHQRVQNGLGENHCVPVSDTAPQASWVLKDGPRQTASAGEQARGYIRLRTYPTGDSGLRLVVTPEIRFGQPKARFGVAEGSFTYSARQSTQMLEELKFETQLKPGQTLVLGANRQLSDLGGFLFGPSAGAGFGQRLILVRLVHSQRDDLFESGVDHVSTNSL